MNSILEDISKKLNCPIYIVRYRLMYKENANSIAKFIKEKGELETNYYDRNGMKRKIRCDGITTTGAHLVKAFGDLGYPFNISNAEIMLSLILLFSLIWRSICQQVRTL